MGKVLIVPGVDFSLAGLGKVTLTNSVPISGLSIVGRDVVFGSAIYRVSYSPIDTSQRGVAWSITSGGTYASINSNTGEVTALEGASLSEVVIRATSSANNLVYAEKTIHVSESGVETEVEYIGASAASDALPLYINTGIKPSTDKKYEIIFGIGESEESVVVYVFGTTATSGSSDTEFNAGAQHLQYLVSYVGSPGTIYMTDRQKSYASSTSVSAEAGQKYKLVFEDTYRLYVGSSETASYTSGTGTRASSNYPVLIGAIAEKSGTSASNYLVRRTDYKRKLLIYGFRVYDGSGNIAYFKPYLVDGVPCLKDTVNDVIKYYIGTTGTLYYKLSGEGEQEQSIEL